MSISKRRKPTPAGSRWSALSESLLPPAMAGCWPPIPSPTSIYRVSGDRPWTATPSAHRRPSGRPTRRRRCSTLVGSVEMGTGAPRSGWSPVRPLASSPAGWFPLGADAVVMVEHTEADRRDYDRGHPGRRAASRTSSNLPTTSARGATLLERGTRLRPQELGLLAALGCCRGRGLRSPGRGHPLDRGRDRADRRSNPSPDRSAT